MGSFYRPVNESQTVSATAEKAVTVFWWRGSPSKALDTINDAALNLWNRGGIVNNKFKGDEAGTEFSSLTRNEKLTLIEIFLKNQYMHLASEQNVETQTESARAAAIAENATKYELSNGS